MPLTPSSAHCAKRRCIRCFMPMRGDQSSLEWHEYGHREQKYDTLGDRRYGGQYLCSTVNGERHTDHEHQGRNQQDRLELVGYTNCLIEVIHEEIIGHVCPGSHSIPRQRHYAADEKAAQRDGADDQVAQVRHGRPRSAPMVAASATRPAFRFEIRSTRFVTPPTSSMACKEMKTGWKSPRAARARRMKVVGTRTARPITAIATSRRRTCRYKVRFACPTRDNVVLPATIIQMMRAGIRYSMIVLTVRIVAVLRVTSATSVDT